MAVDVDDFEAAAAIAASTGAPEDIRHELTLWSGELLPEDLYEDWTMVERERLANAYMDILDRLAAHYMESGQLRESIRACYRVLERDRCHEDSYRLLMRCYARLGMLGRALRQYRLCEKILGQEYGTTPSPETTALYESLLEK